MPSYTTLRQNRHHAQFFAGTFRPSDGISLIGRTDTQVLPQTTDEQLMTAVRLGNTGKLAVLFNRHHAGLFRYAMRMTGQREWSEDLVQEIFVRVLRYRETYRDGNLFTTWVYRIARNAYIDQARKRRREVHTEEPVDLPVNPSNGLEQNQDLELLRQALDKLPEAQRELLVLARFQQMPYEQIAALLEIETGTVKTRVHRAVKQLRDIYFQLSGRPHAWRTA